MSWVERMTAVKRRKEAREKAEEIRQKKERYQHRANSFRDVLDSLAKARARAAALQDVGCAVPEPDFAVVTAALKRELDKKFHEFYLENILRPWRAKSEEWDKHLDERLREVTAKFPGADLETDVLAALRPHFPEVVDGIKERAAERGKLRQRDGVESLKVRMELHDADQAALEQMAGEGASEDWKEELLRLVRGEGIPWTELESGPLREWLTKHDLLRHCRVRLR